MLIHFGQQVAPEARGNFLETAAGLKAGQAKPGRMCSCWGEGVPPW